MEGRGQNGERNGGQLTQDKGHTMKNARPRMEDSGQNGKRRTECRTDNGGQRMEGRGKEDRIWEPNTRVLHLSMLYRVLETHKLIIRQKRL
jgi:hypothetical protein